MTVKALVAKKRTTSFADPPPSIAPTGHETLAGDDVQVLVDAGDPFTKSEMLFTATAELKLALMTTCVAVAPPSPDSFLNRVIETASPPPAVRTCGATISVTHDAFDVAVDGVMQMFGLAARPPLAHPPRGATKATGTSWLSRRGHALKG